MGGCAVELYYLLKHVNGKLSDADEGAHHSSYDAAVRVRVSSKLNGLSQCRKVIVIHFGLVEHGEKVETKHEAMLQEALICPIALVGSTVLEIAIWLGGLQGLVGKIAGFIKPFIQEVAFAFFHKVAQLVYTEFFGKLEGILCPGRIASMMEQMVYCARINETRVKYKLVLVNKLHIGG